MSLFVDSSNWTTTKRHAHLRSTSPSSPRKSPPTCTVFLASVTTVFAVSRPHLSSLRVPFPKDADAELDSCSSDSVSRPAESWRRPRARTSHVQTPRRPQAPPSKPRRTSKVKPSSAGSVPRSDASGSLGMLPFPKHPSPADLRLAALVERSIAANTTEAADPQLDEQDAYLSERLRSYLALHGCRVRSPSPIGSIAGSRRRSVLASSGRKTADIPPSGAKPPFLTSRSRSRSRGSTSSLNATLDMSSLVATLLIRRHESGRSVSPMTFILQREARQAAAPSPSRLRTHVVVSSSSVDT
ncbi:hypothetical protein R3P38DRAFT_616403 [Favolaschia claudopus]|uniref:Uncharacterized protein n=1 Tax=Favolaschia claudopus TaxID=2862362 RepID=A0AAW0CAE4_9AGAR